MESIDDCQFRFVGKRRLNEGTGAHGSTILSQSESENGVNKGWKILMNPIADFHQNFLVS